MFKEVYVLSFLSDALKEFNKEEDNCDRWKLWEDHRKIIKELQEKNIFSNNRNIDDAIILGAGSCGDIDLNYLCSKVSKLTLVDIDLESMKVGVEKQNLSRENYDKLELIGDVDFTGLQDISFYEDLQNLLKEGAKPKKILRLITKSLQNIGNSTSLSQNSYSLVISGAVHSQLTALAIELLNKFSHNYRKKDLVKIHKDLIYMDDLIALKYNDLIMSLAKDDAIIFSWFNLKEFSEEQNNLDDINKVSEYCQQGNSDKVIELVTENKYVGFHGYLDLNKRALEKDLKIQPWVNFWTWQLKTKKYFLVFSITIDLTKN